MYGDSRLERFYSIYMYSKNLSKSTDHGTDFKWTIYAGGWFKQLGSNLEYLYNGIVWAILWDPNKAINIGEWSTCGGGHLERFYCTCIYSKTSLNRLSMGQTLNGPFREVVNLGS